ncbi:unnamed protein product [Darwinula stevensoni]|uniref:Farnesyl pyrophosphate synthase n=1 Tax=Darwinula stevensoni TaxID=69355 RepID=A0A7R9A0S4_9CRUS|nr:unnamed protein product [Darwinula stevensoni]CAG0881868.1 unnamed protein product [Darwinula stevensoni]
MKLWQCPMPRIIFRSWSSSVASQGHLLDRCSIRAAATLPFGILHSPTRSRYGSSASNHNSVPSAYTSKSLTSKEERREFMSLFPDIVRDLTADPERILPDVERWFSKVLQYNVPGGKKNRGIATMTAYKSLASPGDLTPENLHLVHILGWCVEMMHTFFLIVDDIADGSELRRGKPSWYRVKDVGLRAINDAFMMEQGIYYLLRKYFRNKPYYVDIMELFHDCTIKTTVGQCLDLQSGRDEEGNIDLSSFTMDRYTKMVKYKTAYYSFYLPVALSMFAAGVQNPELLRQAKTILLEMGEFFQVQDDYLDCFGDPNITGKQGKDIEDGKCSWLAVVALQRGMAPQRAIMKEKYGRKDPACVERIKCMYEELRLPSVYEAYEEQTYRRIYQEIQQTSVGIPQAFLMKYMTKLYRRRE